MTGQTQSGILRAPKTAMSLRITPRNTPRSSELIALGTARGGDPAGIDPGAWKIVDGKLYLNYSREVQKMWEADVPFHIRLGNENRPRLIKH